MAPADPPPTKKKKIPLIKTLQASTLIRLAHEFYTDSKKHQFVHTFNHAPSSFDFKRMLDSMGHNTADIPQSS